MLRQLSYAINSQLKAPKAFHTFHWFLWHKFGFHFHARKESIIGRTLCHKDTTKGKNASRNYDVTWTSDGESCPPPTMFPKTPTPLCCSAGQFWFLSNFPNLLPTNRLNVLNEAVKPWIDKILITWIILILKSYLIKHWLTASLIDLLLHHI